MKKKFIIFTSMLCMILLCACTPQVVRMVNDYNYSLHKANDETNYNTIKQVEDSCRAMISSYESDKMMYETYKNGESAEQRIWSEQAKLRANKTAITYNNYILKNSFIWKDNIPNDIKEELQVIE